MSKARSPRQSKATHSLPRRGPLGDTIPESEDYGTVEGGEPQERVEKRPNIGTVKPDEYPDPARLEKGNPRSR